MLVFSYYIENLREAVLTATEEKELVQVHSEYSAVKDFLEFISSIAKKGN